MSYTLVLEWMPGDLYMSAVTARCTAPTSSYSVVWLPPNKVYQITLYCGSTSLVSFLVGAFRGKAWSYMNSKTKKITTIGMLCAITYVIMAVGRIPVILFLKYDPSDVIVTLGGLIWGPMTSCIVSVIVATIEMITVSDTGILGCIMNIVQTVSFACTASAIYKKKRTMSGAVIGLFVGCVTTVSVMMLWNYLITPLYMGYPREAVVELLLPAFLPFNLLKSVLNSAITFLLYKPVITALRKSGYVAVSEKENSKQKRNGLILLAVMIIITCILIILSMNGII